MTPKIELTDVKSLGDKHVLCGLNLSVQKDESVVVIGGSGTGKSVLLKSILGILSPENGFIKIDGVEATHSRSRELDTHMAKFGMLFQGSALFDSITVWQNVAFKLVSALHMPKRQAKDKAINALASVGLGPDVGELYPAELSLGGMQKRVALARAIVADPEIVFFDEPTTGLDPIMADVINELIVKCVKERHHGPVDHA